MSVQASPARVRDFLSRDERAAFVVASDRVAWLQVAANLGLVGGAFALAGFIPHPVTAIVATLVLGGRYVGLGILNHDAAHNALFATRWLNRAMGRWVFSGPTLLDFDTYRRGHLAHHKDSGTREDPDLPFVRAYPVSRASMRRKLTRDLSGRTGLRDSLFLLAMSIRHARAPSLVAHAVMLGALWAAGIGWTYALWWLALIFVVPVCLRVRVMGEHGNVPNLLSADARDHARTTHAGWLARTFIAPNYVNYHCEHHFFASVPGHKLPALHRLLVERGFYDAHPKARSPGYLSVVRACVGDRADRPDLGDVGRGKASLANMA
ncbi:MAG: fatty acid desaturase family protein [Myxococcota bacterium]